MLTLYIFYYIYQSEDVSRNILGFNSTCYTRGIL